MNIEEVSNKVGEMYSLNISSIEKVKNVYKITSGSMTYCLKVISYEFGHFLFILSAIKHLQRKGFESTPEIILNKNDEEYIFIDNSFAYLTKWIDSRECNYENPIDIATATRKLGELHIKSEGFHVTKKMHPRVGWFKWIETFDTRKNEIIDFQKKIYSKDKIDEFDEIYLSMIEEELSRAEDSIDNLANSDYLFKMSKEVEKMGFCHHDFAHHNVLISNNNKVNIIDFDYCILDSHLHDLSSLLIRRMKNGKWDIENAKYIFDAYNEVNSIEENDIPIIASFIEFPQEFWQIGIQYYWEKKSWGEEFFKNKLLKIFEDREDRQEFVSELISYRRS